MAFINATTASCSANDINLFQYLEPGYGIGLRILMNKQARTNIDLDHGCSSFDSSGFYIRPNQTF